MLTTELQHHWPWPELVILLSQFQKDGCTPNPFLLCVPETEVRLFLNGFPQAPQLPAWPASGLLLPSAGIAGVHRHTWPTQTQITVLLWEVTSQLLAPQASLSPVTADSVWPCAYRQLAGQLLLDPLQQGVRGLLGAQQDQLYTVVPAKDQALGQNANPHHSLEHPRWWGHQGTVGTKRQECVRREGAARTWPSYRGGDTGK